MPPMKAGPLMTGAGSADPTAVLSQLQQDPQIQQMLGAFGVGLPQHLRENMILPEAGTPGFFGQHPRVARGMENALLAVGNMGPTSESAGENISNVARSLMQIPQEHRAFMMQQLMAPFSIAQEVGNMQKTAAETDYYHGRAQFYRQHGDFYDNWQENHPGGTAAMYNHFINNADGTVSGVRRDTGLKETIVDKAGTPVKIAAKDADSLNHAFLQSKGLLPEQKGMEEDTLEQSMREGEIAHKGLLHDKLDVAIAGAARQQAVDNLPGHFTPEQTDTLNNTRETVNKTIGSLQEQQRQADEYYRQGKSAMDAPPNTTDYVKWRQDTGKQIHEQLQQQIDAHTQALQAYPAAFSAMPGLTYDQFFQGLHSGAAQVQPSGTADRIKAGANPSAGNQTIPSPIVPPKATARPSPAAGTNLNDFLNKYNQSAQPPSN